MAKERFSNELKEKIGEVYNNGNDKEIKDLVIEYGASQSIIRYWALDKKKSADTSARI